MSDTNHLQELPGPPERPSDGHKGTFGRVLILAGSEGMSGAACLSGYGALRGGAGLVTLAVPKSIVNIVAGVEPSWLTLPLDAVDGGLSHQAIPSIDQAISTQSAVAVGPGLGRAAPVRTVVHHVYATSTAAVVLDADGLNAYIGETEKLTRRLTEAHRILTPHPGEFSRLVGIDSGTIRAHRKDIAMGFAADHRVTLLLKGAGTVITDGERVAINATGNSGMATGGSGDVLTGLIASLLAQGLDAFAAAQLGAHLHGLAGDLAAHAQGERAMIATDICDWLGKAWQTYEAGI